MIITIIETEFFLPPTVFAVRPRGLWPSRRSGTAWCALGSFGGGFLGGDEVDVDVDMEKDTVLTMTTQVVTEMGWWLEIFERHTEALRAPWIQQQRLLVIIPYEWLLVHISGMIIIIGITTIIIAMIIIMVLLLIVTTVSAQPLSLLPVSFLLPSSSGDARKFSDEWRIQSRGQDTRMGRW